MARQSNMKGNFWLNSDADCTPRQDESAVERMQLIMRGGELDAFTKDQIRA